MIKSLCLAMVLLAGVSSARANLIGYLDADSVRGNAHGTLVWTGGGGGFDFWVGPDEIKLQVGDSGEFTGEHYLHGGFFFLTPFGNSSGGTGGGGGIFSPGFPSTKFTGDTLHGTIPNKYGDIHFDGSWNVPMNWDGTKFTGAMTGTWSLHYNYPTVPDDGTGTAALLGISLLGVGAVSRWRGQRRK